MLLTQNVYDNHITYVYILIEVGVPAKTMYYIKFYEGNPVGLRCSLPFAVHCYSF